VSEHKTRRETSLTTWYVTGVMLAVVLGGGVFEALPTEGQDWFLEHRALVTVGCGLVGVLFVLVAVAWRRSQKKESDSQ